MRIAEALAHHLLGQIGHIRAATARDIDNPAGLFLNNSFHVCGPYHEKISEILDQEEPDRLQQWTGNRNHRQGRQIGLLKQAQDAQLLDPWKGDHQVATRTNLRWRSHDLNGPSGLFEQLFGLDHFAGVLINQKAPVDLLIGCWHSIGSTKTLEKA
jgi:hypothetical protein